MKRLPAIVAATALIAALPSTVLGWGSSGHRFIGEAAMKALPAELPAFLRNPQAALDVGEYSREPDRLKSAGRARDNDMDAAHFLDLGDDGKIFGGPALSALPPTRAEYEAQLQKVGVNSWKAGYLPYSIVEAYQTLAKDLAYWRVLDAAEKNRAWAEHKAFFTADRRRREVKILADIGQLSHFVGDGSQPLHVTIHFNGWGDYPNPQGFTTAKIHEPFEGALVRATVTPAAIAAKMTPLKTPEGAIDKQVADYLAVAGALVGPLYAMEKAGGMAPGDPRGTALATQQIAAGASELRDLIAEAWTASATGTAGWRPIPVADVLSGKTDPYPALYSID
jgi:hypothetical protein